MLKIVETFTVKLIDLRLSSDCQDEHCDGGDAVFHNSILVNGQRGMFCHII